MNGIERLTGASKHTILRARINSAVRMSPAMACGLEQRLWDIGDIVKLIEAAE